jgi:hypothetical protein
MGLLLLHGQNSDWGFSLVIGALLLQSMSALEIISKGISLTPTNNSLKIRKFLTQDILLLFQEYLLISRIFCS